MKHMNVVMAGVVAVSLVVPGAVWAGCGACGTHAKADKKAHAAGCKLGDDLVAVGGLISFRGARTRTLREVGHALGEAAPGGFEQRQLPQGLQGLVFIAFALLRDGEGIEPCRHPFRKCTAIPMEAPFT